MIRIARHGFPGLVEANRAEDRQLGFLLPAAYVLARYGATVGNSDLVWWSYPIAEVASLVMTLIFFRRIYRTLIEPLPLHGAQNG